MDAGVSSSTVDHGYGDWRAAYLRAAWQADSATTLLPEIVASQEFHDRGAFFGLGATRTLSQDWNALGEVATSAGGFYLPRLRAAATLSRKLLTSRRLVINGGAAYTKWKDAHSDAALSAGAAYYFTTPWIVEAGTNWNSSRPGNVLSRSYFGALTEGRDGSRYLILRASGGREAYQPLAQGQAIADFASRDFSLTWRQWLRRNAGITIAAEHYSNPFYHRTGLSLGAFWHIQ